MKANQNKSGGLQLRFHIKCSKCAGRGKMRGQRCCHVCSGRGYVLNSAGRVRWQEMQEAWQERLQA